MRFTEKDASICKMLFNESTHEMGMLMYQERAKEIYWFVCNKVLGGEDFFDFKRGDAFRFLLDKEPTASFFFENNLVDFECFEGFTINFVIKWSPIAEKIWDSGVLDQYLHDLEGFGIYKILSKSPICEKIWDSGKLDKYLHKMDTLEISWLLRESPIADKVKASGKIKQKKE